MIKMVIVCDCNTTSDWLKQMGVRGLVVEWIITLKPLCSSLVGKAWFSLNQSIFCFWVELKRIYFTLIEKQVLTTCTDLSRFCFLGTTPVPATNVWASESPKNPGNRTRDLKTARPTLYLTTTGPTIDQSTLLFLCSCESRNSSK